MKNKGTDKDLLAMLEATAYDLWQSSLAGMHAPRGRGIYERMRSPEIGDTVMEVTTYRRKKDRMGFGKLISKEGNGDYIKWTIETPDGKICDWHNALVIAIPLGTFEWYPSRSNAIGQARRGEAEPNQKASSATPAPTCCVIFLDFDGVIRVAVEGGWIGADQAEFCQARMKMLAAICTATDAAIVVSSDWRNLENRGEIEGHLSPYLAEHLHPDWATPITGHRWNEVEGWLTKHPEVERYAILEDFAPHFDGCGRVMEARLVLCSNRYGLVPELMPRITEILSHNAE